MTEEKAVGGVAAIIEAAEKTAEEGRDANYMGVRTAPDRTRVTLTTVIKGTPLAWIEFDGPQLDELIRLLEAHRADLR